MRLVRFFALCLRLPLRLLVVLRLLIICLLLHCLLLLIFLLLLFLLFLPQSVRGTWDHRPAEQLGRHLDLRLSILGARHSRRREGTAIDDELVYEWEGGLVLERAYGPIELVASFRRRRARYDVAREAQTDHAGPDSKSAKPASTGRLYRRLVPFLCVVCGRVACGVCCTVCAWRAVLCVLWALCGVSGVWGVCVWCVRVVCVGCVLCGVEARVVCIVLCVVCCECCA